MPTASGGTIEVSVPSGPTRLIQVFGMQSKVGCGDLNTILNQPPGSRFNGLGDPYLLGQATTDLFAHASVAVHAWL